MELVLIDGFASSTVPNAKRRGDASAEDCSSVVLLLLARYKMDNNTQHPQYTLVYITTTQCDNSAILGRDSQSSSSTEATVV